ncbi:MAG: lysophospholipase [Firmicutes bacterium]|nr:lysophospholipase [Bacillota bacterium]
MQNEKLNGYNGYEINLKKFVPLEIKASVILVHGMSEHSGRYTDFCEFLKSNGYLVVAFDLRNHGTASPLEKIGFCEGQNYLDNLEDIYLISEHLKETYQKPVHIFAHSYGSFITQHLIQKYPLAACRVVMSGSAHIKKDAKAGKRAVSFCCAFKDKEAPAKLLHNMSFKRYNKKYVQKNKDALATAWLTEDEAVQLAYYKDPLCTQTPFRYGFYKSFFTGVLKAYKKENLAKIDKNIKILLLSGDDDAVAGKNAKLLKRLYNQYKKLGLDVTLKLFKGGRHELLNSKFKEQAKSEVLEFFSY